MDTRQLMPHDFVRGVYARLKGYKCMTCGLVYYMGDQTPVSTCAEVFARRRQEQQYSADLQEQQNG